MKKITPFVCIALAVFIATRCSNPSPAPDRVGNSVIPLDPTDTSIFERYDHAQQNIKCFDSLSRTILGDTPIQYYTVRARDIFAAIGMDSSILKMPNIYKYRYFRVTLAFKRDSNQFKLYIQPVSDSYLNAGDPGHWKAGKALFFKKDGTIDSTSTPDTNPSIAGSLYVADLNAPCPNTCGN
jgi:hypothetical protein